MIELKDDNFKTTILDNESLNVVDFFAEWCAPCKVMSEKVFPEVEEELKGVVNFYKVDADENYDLTSEFGIRSLPTLIYFKGNREIYRSSGLVQKQALIDNIKIKFGI